jgi:signal transduction histidine kinase
MVAEGQKEAFERAAGGAPIGAVLEILARTAQEQSVSNVRTAIFILDANERLRFSATAGMPEGYTGAMDGFSIGPQAPSCGLTAYTGQAVIVRDVEQDPLWLPYVSLAREHGFRACWSFPIRSFGGKVLGTFALYHPAVREPDSRDLDLVNLLAETAAVLIGRHGEAENRKRAEESLRESEERFRDLADKLDAEVRVRTGELEERNAEILGQTEQLRLLSNRLMRSQDDERRRIARELHDSAGQYLAALGMSLEAARRSATELPPKVTEKLDEATEIVGKCSSEIRTLSHLLHPPLLEELGLASAIEWYVEGFASRSDVEVKLQIPPKLKRLDEPIELALFRVLQECLTNIHRHSGSKTAIVKVEADEHRVNLEVIDRGRGIPKPLLETRFAASKRLGVGINGMRERLKDLGGTLEIHSTNLGTTARAIIPLRQPAAATAAS